MELFGCGLFVWTFIIIPTCFIWYEIFWVFYCLTFHPLSSIPGPVWPSVSRTWIMYQMHRGHIEEAIRQLHSKYGPVVRVAPNEVSASEASAIPKIYSTQHPLTKSDFYPMFRPIGISKRPDMFTNTDEKDHFRHRKIVNPVYRMSSVLKNESAIDESLSMFIKRIGEFADRREVLDLGYWIEMYAYDLVGVIFFGNPFGMLEKGRDHLNYIENVWNGLPLLCLAACAPSYMRVLIMLGSLLIPAKFRAAMAVNRITAEALRQTAKRKSNSEKQDLRNDLLSQLFRVASDREADHKYDFTQKEVALEAWVAIMAGADSTSVAQRAIFYILMKHPIHLAKATAEIREADAAGKLSTPVKAVEGMNLKYTCACIREAMRIFPPFQFHMPRVAPVQGLELSGHRIPAGYVVGVNPALCQFDERIFGPDAHEFKPERWLESLERSFAMEKAILHFGSGTRTCIGKNIALTEIHKTIPEVLRRFSFEMSHDRGWKTRNSCFIMQHDLTVHVKRRE